MVAVAVSEQENIRRLLRRFLDTLEVEGTVQQSIILDSFASAYPYLETQPFDFLIIDLECTGTAAQSHLRKPAIELLNWCKQTGRFHKVIGLRPLGPNILTPSMMKQCCHLGACGNYGEGRCLSAPFNPAELSSWCKRVGKESKV